MSLLKTIEKGKPAPENECWLRNLINTDHVTSEGTVHFQALKKNTIAPVDAESWSHELSGRLASIAGADIKQNGEAAAERARKKFEEKGKPVPSKIKFVGVACAKVAVLKTCSEARTDVIYTPLPDDQAHADFVVYDAHGKDNVIDGIRVWLQRTLTVVKADEVRGELAPCPSDQPAG